MYSRTGGKVTAPRHMRCYLDEEQAKGRGYGAGPGSGRPTEHCSADAATAPALTARRTRPVAALSQGPAPERTDQAAVSGR
jgi:hypothetical protein